MDFCRSMLVVLSSDGEVVVLIDGEDVISIDVEDLDRDSEQHTYFLGLGRVPRVYMEDLDLRMKRAGYVSKTNVVLHDVEEEEKERMVRYHSERLAVAYGIMRVPQGNRYV
ncbi:hypothetical protein Bca4012_097808 [Brassica carinata]